MSQQKEDEPKAHGKNQKHSSAADHKNFNLNDGYGCQKNHDFHQSNGSSSSNDKKHKSFNSNSWGEQHFKKESNSKEWNSTKISKFKEFDNEKDEKKSTKFDKPPLNASTLSLAIAKHVDENFDETSDSKSNVKSRKKRKKGKKKKLDGGSIKPASKQSKEDSFPRQFQDKEPEADVLPFNLPESRHLNTFNEEEKHLHVRKSSINHGKRGGDFHEKIKVFNLLGDIEDDIDNFIENFVHENYTLEDLNVYLLAKFNGKFCQRDINYAIAKYEKCFFEILPDKCKSFINDVIDNSEEGDIMKWIYSVYGNKSNETFMDLFKTSKFYKPWKMVIKRYDKSAPFIITFFNNMCTHFRDGFKSSKKFDGLLGIYRCLLCCKNDRSPIVCDAVKSLWKKLYDTDVMITSTTSKEDEEHNMLTQLVEEFYPESVSTDKFLLESIKEMFEPLTFTVRDNGKTLVVTGYTVTWSELSIEFFEHYDATKFEQIVFLDYESVTMDEDLCFPGKNVQMISKNTIFPKPIICNLSGKDGVDTRNLEIPAKSGKDFGECGDDGQDGVAGDPSGSLEILTSNLTNKENLEVILIGGNGTRGQDGGNGFKGKEGDEKKFDEVFDSNYFSGMKSHYWKNFLTGGICDRHGAEYVNEDDRFYSRCSCWFSSHLGEVYFGKPGKAGSAGGQNGIGGPGGKKGECIVQCNNKPVDLDNLLAHDGEDGTAGMPGLYGENGKDGCDIGITDTQFGSTYKHGENNNEKLEVLWGDYASDRIYVSTKSAYAYVSPKKAGCTALQEKRAKTKDVNERKGDAIARRTNLLSMNYAQQMYDEVCHSERKNIQHVKNEEEQEAEAEAKLNRLLEISQITKKEIYVPKQRHIVPEIPSKALRSDNLNNMPGVISPKDADLLKPLLNNKVADNENLKKKLVLSQLRNQIYSFSLPDDKAFTEQLQINVRDFSPYLKKGSDCPVVDPCVGALCDNPNYSELIEKAVKTIDILPVLLFSKYAAVFNSLLEIQVDGKPIFESKMEIDAVLEGLKHSKFKKPVHEALQKISTTTHIVEALPYNLCQLIEELHLGEDYSNIPKELQTNETNCLFLFVHLYEKVMSNVVLAEALSLFIGDQSDEFLDQYNIELPTGDADVYFWLNMANMENVRDKWLEEIVKAGKKCAAGRKLLAWKTKANIRIYKDNRLIEDHLPYNVHNIHHMETNDKVDEFHPLSINKNRVVLENERLQKSHKIIENMEKLRKECKCENLLQHDTVKTAEWCSMCEAYEQGAILFNHHGDTKLILQKLLFYFGEKTDILYKDLKLWCDETYSIGIKFIDSLLTIFETDGCHIDFTTFKYLFDSAFFSSQNCPTQSDEIFPSILFSTSQSDWIDEFFIFNIESNLKCSVSERKDELRKSLRNISDENLKILFSQKLQDEETTLTELLQTLSLMERVDDVHPILCDLKLKMWPHVIEKYQLSRILRSQETCFLNEKEKEKALFYCCKLAERFALEEVETVYSLFGKQPNFKIDEKFFGKLVYQLCEGNIDLENSTLKGIFGETLRRCSSKSNIAGISITSKDVEVVNEFLKSSSGECYTKEDWIKYFKKKNELNVTQAETLSLFSKNFPADVQDKIKNFAKELKNHESPEACAKILKEFFDELEYPCKDFDHFLVEIVSHVISKNRESYLRDNQKEFHFRENQKFAALAALKNDHGLLQQLDTGEGKSLVITAVSIIKVLKGETVNIITSSSLLAKRDTECTDPVGCNDIYKVFGIKAAHICVSSSKIRAEKYANNHIIYGDITTFQYDYLLNETKNILGNRKFDNVIVDEVDSLLLDKASNMLYLSHGIAEMESLQSLLVKVMVAVHVGIKNNLNEKDIYEDLYKRLFNNNENEEIEIPTHLIDYAKMHLKEWITNAKDAFYMEEKVDYVVDIVHSTVSTDILPKIVIIDRGTGVDLPTTQWSKGLHQFVQLKHAVKLDAISTKAAFISNVTYLKKFKNLYGFTGTLGLSAERQQLSTAYKIECLILPPSRPKQFYEEPSIVTVTEESHTEELFNSIYQKIREKRSVLIVCESSKKVDQLYNSVINFAKNSLSKKELKAFKEACLYRRDHEKFDYGEGKKLQAGKIIFATNLAGRGTDIKITDELRNNGGLHVITTFLPENLRIEEQAEGRVARCGDPGSAQLIILAEESEYGKFGHISKLKAKRDADEFLRTEEVLKYYENTTVVEEKCRVHFIEAMKKIRKQLSEQRFGEEEKKLAEKDITDQWALHMDATGLEDLTGEQRIENEKQFCESLTIVGNNKELILTQPMNVLRYGILKALRGNYDSAEILFNQIIDKHPYYATEAKFCLVFVKARKNNIEGAEKLMVEVRNGFEKRQAKYYSDLSIINYFKKNNESRLFKTDAFAQQQNENLQLINLFLMNSVLGEKIDSTDFTSPFITQQNSVQLYNFLVEQHFINRFPVKENYNKQNLNEYCHERDVMTNALDDYENGKINRVQFIKAMNPPNVEKFWIELKNKSLIKNVKKHLYFDTSKLSNVNTETMELLEKLKVDSTENEATTLDNSKSRDRRIFQHSFVLNETWEELDLNRFKKLKSDKRYDEIFKILEFMQVIFFTESAELIEKSEEELLSINFDQFGSISSDAFLHFGYSQEKNDKILQMLVERKILNKTTSNVYLLNYAETSSDTESAWETLDPKIENILNQKFVFITVYRKLQQMLKEDEPLQIKLPTLIKCSPYNDLIHCGILEQSNVNKKALNKSLLSSAIKEFSKQTSIEIDDVSIERIQQILYQKAKVTDKFETPYAKLVPLKDKLPEYDLVELKFSSLMVEYGLSHLIVFDEAQKSAYKKFFAIILGAVVQLALGGVLTVCSCGAGVFASNFFIAEGISDILYGFEGLCSGFTDSYFQHKKQSLITNGVLYGIGGLFAYGGKMNPIAYALKGPACATNGMKHMGLKGLALVKADGFGPVVKATTKHVLLQVGKSLANCAIFHVLQKSLQWVIDEFIRLAKEKIMDETKKAFNGSENMKKLLHKVFSKLGIVEGRKLVNECAKRVFNAQDRLEEICNFVFREHRQTFINFFRGVADGKNHCQKAMTKTFQMFVSNLPNLFAISQFGQMVKSLHNKLTSYMTDIEKSIQVQYKAKRKHMEKLKEVAKKSDEIETVEPVDIERATNEVIEEWQNQMGVIVSQNLQSRVAIPLLSLAASKIEAKCEKMISNIYNNWKEKNDIKEFNRLKKGNDARQKNCATKEEREKAVKAYEEKLLILLKNSQSVKVYVKILEQGVKIDQMGASYVAIILSDIFKQSVVVNVKNKDGSTYTHKAGKSDKNVKVINIDLFNQHYGDTTKTEKIAEFNKMVESQKLQISDPSKKKDFEKFQNFLIKELNSASEEKLENDFHFLSKSRNSCLYDEIVRQVPEIKADIPDDKAFRSVLGQAILNDPCSVQAIQNGWHAFPIEKNLIGGSQLPVNNEFDKLNQQSNQFKETFNKFIDSNQPIQRYKKTSKILIQQYDSFMEAMEEKFSQIPELKELKKERMKEIKNERDKLKTILITDFNDMKDLDERKEQINKFNDFVLKTVNDFVQTLPDSAIAKERKVDELYQRLGDVEKAKQVNPDSSYKTRFKPMNESITEWSKLADITPSKATREKLWNVHSNSSGTQNDLPLTASSKLVGNVVKLLQQNCEEIYSPEKGNTPDHPGKHTFAAKRSSDGKNLNIAANYFKDGETLSQKQKEKLVEKVIAEHGAELKDFGIKNIQFIERDSTTRPSGGLLDFLDKNVCEELFVDKSTIDNTVLAKDLHDAIKTDRHFYKRAHVEAILLAHEMQEGVPAANLSGGEMGVGKGSCLNCQSMLDNVGIFRDVVRGQVQNDIRRYEHPNDIKTKVTISKPL